MKNILKYLTPILILCMSGGVYAGLVSYKKKPVQHVVEKKPLSIDVLLVKRKEIVLYVETSGTVQPINEIDLLSAVAGQITFTDQRLLVGSFFRAGETLLKIDDTGYRAATANAQAELAQAELGLTRIEASASQAKRDWQRLGNGEGNPLALYQPQLAEAKAQVKAAAARLKVAEHDLQQTHLVAPFDCIIRKNHIAFGQYIQVGTPLALLFSVEAAEIRLPVRSEDLAKIDDDLLQINFFENRKIPVELSGNQDDTKLSWHGFIVRSEGVVDSSTRRVYLVARVEDPYGLKQTQPVLPIGLYVEGRIRGRTLPNIISIPQGALRQDNTILLVDSDNRLRLQKIHPLHHNGNSLLLQSGLAGGERICLTSLDYVIEGVKVDVTNELVEMSQ